jgi:divalent metal cation (Fe/Co/Zn/Cd) transporter
VTCRRTVALTALIASLPLAALGTALLAEAIRIFALANSQVAAPAAGRWPMVIAVAICLGASLYLVCSGAYRAVQSWSSLVRFAAQSFTTFGVSTLVLLIGVVFVFVATVLGGGIF